MTQINETHVEAIIATCRENTEAIAESLNQCFDRKYRIKLGQSLIWNAEEVDALDGPGLSVIFRSGTQGVLCLIPAALPLPEWYTAPGDSENARLQTLSLEWSMNMLPMDLEAEEFVSIDCENLKQHVLDSEPPEWAGMLELLVFDEADGTEAPAPTADDAEAAESPSDAGDGESDETADETAAETPVAKLYLIAAVEKPLIPKPEPEPVPEAAVAPAQPAAQPSAAAIFASAGASIDRQMQKLPVTVSVRLAEKKIELGQLASITPGGLVTFNKGCESLLDLYVNNHLYGRGEAIKIGEKFGLKVTHVGVTPQRKKRVL